MPAVAQYYEHMRAKYEATGFVSCFWIDVVFRFRFFGFLNCALFCPLLFLLTAWTGPGCKQKLAPDIRHPQVSLGKKSKNWYRHPSVLTANPLLEKGTGRTTTGEDVSQDAVQENQKAKQKNDVYPEARNRKPKKKQKDEGPGRGHFASG